MAGWLSSVLGCGGGTGRCYGRTRRLAIAACLGLGVAGAAVTFDITASAAQEDQNHLINLAGKQRMLSQKMIKEALLIAMGVEVEGNLRNLGATRSLFDVTLTGLRHGDAALDLPRTSRPEILALLTRVDQIWSELDLSLQPVLTDGKLSSAQVANLAELSVPLLKAMDETVKGYETAAQEGRLFSTITMAIDVAGRQRMLSQKMAKEFLLVAYGYDPKRNRAALAGSMALFEKTLTGLIFGDPANRLSPAPSPAIAAQLSVVQRVWAEYAAILRPVADNREVVPETVIPVAKLSQELLSEMSEVVEMYAAL